MWTRPLPRSTLLWYALPLVVHRGIPKIFFEIKDLKTYDTIYIITEYGMKILKIMFSFSPLYNHIHISITQINHR